MLRFLIKRPIAVTMFFLSLLLSGAMVFKHIPVSLLPISEIPEVLLQVNYDNASVEQIEKNVIEPLRQKIQRIPTVSEVESKSSDHYGKITIKCDNGSDIDLLLIEINEAIDALAPTFPADMKRPSTIVKRISDIPLIRIHVTPKGPLEFVEVSQLCSSTIKKRLEQTNGVSLVDLNGTQEEEIFIVPNQRRLEVLGGSLDLLVHLIQQSNLQIGTIRIREGNLILPVAFKGEFSRIEELKEMAIKLPNGSMIRLGELAEIQVKESEAIGFHFYEGKRSIAIAVHKQDKSRISDVMADIEAKINELKIAFPELYIASSQDQSHLVDVSVENLLQDIIISSIISSLLLYLFMGNSALAIVIGVNIPVSLTISCLIFSLFDVSFNIISLSGVALGIGMLIDNSIVVIDSINRNRQNGTSALESAIKGANDVFIPVLSQVLTTIAVYVPIIVVSKISAPLFKDQAIALTILLGISLVASFILTPVLYQLLNKYTGRNTKAETKIFLFISAQYHLMIDRVLKRKKTFIFLTFIFITSGCFLLTSIEWKAMPDTKRNDAFVKIDWNEQVTASENFRRTNEIFEKFKSDIKAFDADIGVKKYILEYGNSSVQEMEFYGQFKDNSSKNSSIRKIQDWVSNHYPFAIVEVQNARNPFEEMVSKEHNQLLVKAYPVEQAAMENAADSILSLIRTDLLSAIPKRGSGLMLGKKMMLNINTKLLSVRQISISAIKEKIIRIFGNFQIATIKDDGIEKKINLPSNAFDLESDQYTVSSMFNISYPIRDFLLSNVEHFPRHITSDTRGRYFSFSFSNANPERVLMEVDKIFHNKGFKIIYEGSYFSDRTTLKELMLIFLAVLGLIYAILIFQYESVVLPLIVMASIPIGVAGASIALWISGGSLNIMSVVGFIVVLGLIVDDPVLKIETLSRLKEQYERKGFQQNFELLERMIHKAGELCLKPLLLVSLTTSLSMVPILMLGGLGNELQKPLAVVIIGGLTMGTLFTTSFTPLAFWYYIKLKVIFQKKKSTNES